MRIEAKALAGRSEFALYALRDFIAEADYCPVHCRRVSNVFGFGQLDNFNLLGTYRKTDSRRKQKNGQQGGRSNSGQNETSLSDHISKYAKRAESVNGDGLIPVETSCTDWQVR